jgi:hypothetical protein
MILHDEGPEHRPLVGYESSRGKREQGRERDGEGAREREERERDRVKTGRRVREADMLYLLSDFNTPRTGQHALQQH